MNDDQCAAHPKHDCYAWNIQVSKNQGDAVMTYCMICDRITSFRWKSLLRHLKEFWK